MCGICGIIDYNKDVRIEESVLKRMCAALKHRGPDDQGIWINNGGVSVGLGHRRLSIIDLSLAGHQPMSNEDNSIWVVLNGEIYNYHELREDLEEKGHKFKSQTDTETLVHLYEEYREFSVERLRGMFAFAVWDKTEQSLLLARDRCGKKPLIYSYQNGRFSFASEFHSLLESKLIKKEIDYRAVHYYLTFGYIPAPMTIFKNVFKVMPGHRVILKKRELLNQQYWSLDYSKKIKISESEAAEQIIALLKDAVRTRLYSDVPLGAFLSGGIDSSAVVALMSQICDKRVKTFSVGFQEQDYNELKFARAIAKRFDTEHHELIIRPKALEILPLLVERYGEPYAESSCIPTYYISKLTRQFVTVALNGDGGDESFAGYERYQAMLAAQVYRSLPKIAKKGIRAAAGILPDAADQKNTFRRIKRFFDGAELPDAQCYLRWISIINDNLKKHIYSDDFYRNIGSDQQPIEYISTFINSDPNLSLIDRILLTDVKTYLPYDVLVKVDIASMTNSLEARSPFLDHHLMEFAARMPAEFKIRHLVKKYLLKKAVGRILPSGNIKRKKMGFGVPVGRWFRNDLKDFLKDVLFSEKALKRGYFNRDGLKRIFKEHTENRADYSNQLWAILMLELWHRRFMD